jgi:hypothetical protein
MDLGRPSILLTEAKKSNFSSGEISKAIHRFVIAVVVIKSHPLT